MKGETLVLHCRHTCNTEYVKFAFVFCVTVCYCCWLLPIVVHTCGLFQHVSSASVKL